MRPFFVFGHQEYPKGTSADIGKGKREPSRTTFAVMNNTTNKSSASETRPALWQGAEKNLGAIFEILHLNRINGGVGKRWNVCPRPLIALFALLLTLGALAPRAWGQQGGGTQTHTVYLANGTASRSGRYQTGQMVTTTARAPASGQVFDKWTTYNNGVTFAAATSKSTTGHVLATATYDESSGSVWEWIWEKVLWLLEKALWILLILVHTGFFSMV
jgi:hypothetical protein